MTITITLVEINWQFELQKYQRSSVTSVHWTMLGCAGCR